MSYYSKIMLQLLKISEDEAKVMDEQFGEMTKIDDINETFRKPKSDEIKDAFPNYPIHVPATRMHLTNIRTNELLTSLITICVVMLKQKFIIPSYLYILVRIVYYPQELLVDDGCKFKIINFSNSKELRYFFHCRLNETEIASLEELLFGCKLKNSRDCLS